MAQKACKSCKAVVEGATCKVCGGQELSEGFKGKIAVMQPENSEIARTMKYDKKGVFSLKL